MQKERKAKERAAADEAAAKKTVRADGEWSGDDFVKQSEALARGTK
jgi:dihydropyrimidine dehydrogenase (NADP+)/dihydropyrimidine dehydrogenase (NAD+) subunit PreA